MDLTVTEAAGDALDDDLRSAVERFGDWHDRAERPATPAGGRYRRELPATPSSPGTQYRFEVDLDRCSGCKACVSACQSLNGLDPGESWRSVGLLVGGGDGVLPWQQHVTTACHHCLEPACLAGCPVDAYDKDPVTGIVAHLDDQCIGCRYCMLTCPYEVPSFNPRLGVVRKCDMCAGRLSAGEAPACVQGCPTEAIRIGVVDTAEVSASLAVDRDERLVPTAPRSTISAPTTVYLTRRAVPSTVRAADDHRVVPASNHPPLVAMLVLTQVSVGAVLFGEVAALTTDWMGPAHRPAVGAAVLSWLMAMVAILASVLHLGRPTMAWRAVLGVRHSWLSREILAFGLYAGVGGVAVLCALGVVPDAAERPAALATATSGLVGVACSAQLYAVTRRAFWRLDRTLVRFGITMSACGAAALVAAASAAGHVAVTGWRLGPLRVAAALVLAAAGVVALVTTWGFQRRHRGRSDELGRSAALLNGPLRRARARSTALGLVAAAVAGASLVLDAGGTASTVAWTGVLVAVVVASWIERRLFFVAVAPDRMPGGLR